MCTEGNTVQSYTVSTYTYALPLNVRTCREGFYYVHVWVELGTVHVQAGHHTLFFSLRSAISPCSAASCAWSPAT